jgi:hypothetical protein
LIFLALLKDTKQELGLSGKFKNDVVLSAFFVVLVQIQMDSQSLVLDPDF